jgi:hypothetical protein
MRLCLRSGVIPRRTLCRWPDGTALIGFRPNVKPLQRHKGVGRAASYWLSTLFTFVRPKARHNHPMIVSGFETADGWTVEHGQFER